MRYAKIGTSEFQKGGAMPEGFIIMQEDKPLEGDYIAQADGTWALPTLHERALPLSMPKEMFVEMVEAVTYGQITFGTIWAWMQANPEIMKLFMLATDVKRNDPKLDEVTAQMAPEFGHYLDGMFVYQDEIMEEINAAKAAGRAINLDAYLLNN